LATAAANAALGASVVAAIAEAHTRGIAVTIPTGSSSTAVARTLAATTTAIAKAAILARIGAAIAEVNTGGIAPAGHAVAHTAAVSEAFGRSGRRREGKNQDEQKR